MLNSMDSKKIDKGKSVVDSNEVLSNSSTQLGFRDSDDLALSLSVPNGGTGRDAAPRNVIGSSRAESSRRSFERENGDGDDLLSDFKRVRYSIDEELNAMNVDGGTDWDTAARTVTGGSGAQSLRRSVERDDDDDDLSFLVRLNSSLDDKDKRNTIIRRVFQDDPIVEWDNLEQAIHRAGPQFEWLLGEMPPVELDLFPLQPMVREAVRVIQDTERQHEEEAVRGIQDYQRQHEEFLRLSAEETIRRIRERRLAYQRETAREVARRLSNRSPTRPLRKEEKDELEDIKKLDEGDDDPYSPFSLAMQEIKKRNSKKCSYKKPVDDLVKPTSQFDVDRETEKKSCGLTGCVKCTPPQLVRLSMKALAKNADAIVSLELVPDDLRYKLGQMVSNSRKLGAPFFELLVKGSPTEIRVKDLSLITEEEFTKIFASCDTRNLNVLQLDLCGQCLTDYALLEILPRSSARLSSLTTISLRGAHRLTDAGVDYLVCSAPTLQSINLSQCPLLSSEGIKKITSHFQTTLKELYIDDCQSINPISILPGLKKLLYLEVLSVAGIETITDEFVIEITEACGVNMKELNLSKCVELTDTSLKSLAKSCPNLCALNLSFLNKLTDTTLKYLANGCRSIWKLELCRNGFSDEAMSAFLEVSLNSLEVLSLNSVSKVSCNTAASIPKCSKLVSLDLSWCRKITDEEIWLIVRQCLDLELLKMFGCTQLTGEFLNNLHSKVKIIGSETGSLLEHFRESIEAPLRYSSSINVTGGS